MSKLVSVAAADGVMKLSVVEDDGTVREIEASGIMISTAGDGMGVVIPAPGRTSEDVMRDLAALATARLERQPPEEQARQRREQRISFVYGQLALSGRAVTKEFVAEVLDDMERKGWTS